MGRKMWLLAACMVALLGCGVSVAAAATPAFDPQISLTGSCKTSSLDEVPDPGLCPMPPGVAGVDHPSTPFEHPSAVATDAYGNIYVAVTGEGSKGSIDIFSPKGEFLTQVPDELGPTNVAVDSKGNLYVTNLSGTEHEEGIVRYDPISPYDPAEGKIEYGSAPTKVVVKKSGSFGLSALAVNPINDQLFVKYVNRVTLYKSAAEENEEIETFGQGLLEGVSNEPVGIAVDAARGRLYIGSQNVSKCPCVYALELAAPHNLLFSISGADVPANDFVNRLFLAADEGSGDLYVYDSEAHAVYRFETSNSSPVYLETIEHGFVFSQGGDIGVDNGANSPNGVLNPKGRYLYVPSEKGGKGGSTGHSYAFGPPSICPPKVESVSFDNVAEAEAELKSSIEPCGLPTHYSLEYLTTQQYEEGGNSFVGAQIAGEGQIPAGTTPVSVAAPATGLVPGTAYRFRVIVTNEEGSAEAEGDFATYPAIEEPPSCSNEALRSGLSTLLPDCRAYELVTPPDTNARAPRGAGPLGAFFAASQASPGGDKVSFALEGGSLPGAEAVGSFYGDPYLSSRSGAGWGTAYAGPSGGEAFSIQFGSTSPDQGFSLWRAEGDGPAVIGGEITSYVRYPDGHSALVGRGSEGTDPRAEARLISENGGHIIFVSSTHLEPNAPPNGTKAVYDRTADEVTHVVSLLPGDETPEPGEGGSGFYGPFEGASSNGRAVAIKLGKTLYVRYDNEETYELGENVTFAGFDEEGTQAFYVEGGDIYRFDIATEARVPFTALGDVVPVNVSADGSTAYFASPTAISGEENPNHEEPVEAKEKWNLYRSHEGTIDFVGVVAEKEILAEEVGIGLGLWSPHVVTYGEVAEDPSRTTPDGNTLLFESHAKLTAYESEGQNEVYRYDSSADELDCLSCNPTLAPPGGGASLQSTGAELLDPEPLGLFARIDNLASNGDRAIFQSTEALVPGDNDNLQDVYEWEAEGVGSCKRPQGCLYLISSGHSNQIDYLFAVSNDGNDVFFRSGDLLLPSDREETPSVYDARVDGGFPEPEPPECEAEGCKPGLTPPPTSPNLASRGGGPSGNVGKQGCPKGKRQVRRHGKVRCVKKNSKRHHHRKAGTKKKGASK